MKNNPNDSSKRTAGHVRAILSRNGINLKARNSGDGNMFSIPQPENDNRLATRIALKRSGFILVRGNATDKRLYFRCH